MFITFLRRNYITLHSTSKTAILTVFPSFPAIDCNTSFSAGTSLNNALSDRYTTLPCMSRLSSEPIFRQEQTHCNFSNGLNNRYLRLTHRFSPTVSTSFLWNGRRRQKRRPVLQVYQQMSMSNNSFFLTHVTVHFV